MTPQERLAAALEQTGLPYHYGRVAELILAADTSLAADIELGQRHREDQQAGFRWVSIPDDFLIASPEDAKDAELGREWRLTEAALPEFCWVELCWDGVEAWGRVLNRLDRHREPIAQIAAQSTPAAALRALREKLA